MVIHVHSVILQCSGTFLGKLCYVVESLMISLYRWEKELDWMAMNGINIVYATTGMEYIYSQVS